MQEKTEQVKNFSKMVIFCGFSLCFEEWFWIRSLSNQWQISVLITYVLDKYKLSYQRWSILQSAFWTIILLFCWGIF